MKIAIHQPDFMPWLGFFTKMKKADVLVVLDHTENNPREAAFWGRRVKIAVNNTAQWLSIPLEKVQGRIGVPINEMKINLQNLDFIQKNLARIKYNYVRTPFFKDFFPLVEDYFSMDDSSLVSRNMFFIETVKDWLDIKTKIVFSSQMFPEKKSTGLLIELVQKLHGDVYISGDGAGCYMDLSLFADAGIRVEFNNFKHPFYTQQNTSEFIPGLTIFDALMNIDTKGVKDLLQNLIDQSEDQPNIPSTNSI